MTQALFNLEILGDKELQKKLNRFADKDQKKAVNNGLKKATAFIRQQARKDVKSATGGTGASGKAIKSKKIKAKGRRGFVGWRVSSGTREDIASKSPLRKGILTSKGYYPAVIEHGSKKRNIKPFRTMRKTFTSNHKKVTSIVEAEINSMLNKLAQK